MVSIQEKCLVNQYDNTIKVDNINNNYKKCNIEYDFKLKRISKPSIVSIPFLIQIIEHYIHKKIFSK